MDTVFSSQFKRPAHAAPLVADPTLPHYVQNDSSFHAWKIETSLMVPRPPLEADKLTNGYKWSYGEMAGYKLTNG